MMQSRNLRAVNSFHSVGLSPLGEMASPVVLDHSAKLEGRRVETVIMTIVMTVAKAMRASNLSRTNGKNGNPLLPFERIPGGAGSKGDIFFVPGGCRFGDLVAEFGDDVLNE